MAHSQRETKQVPHLIWSANPRYDLLTEGTFAVVEMLQGQHWTPVYDDDDFSLFFKWKVDDSYLYSMATIEWEIPKEAGSGYIG